MDRTTTEPTPALKVWDLPTRLFHWLLVAAVAVAWLSSEEDSALAAWHQAAGWTAAMLIVFRLIWGFVGGEHARFADFLRPGRLAHHLGQLRNGRPSAELGHNPLGALAVVALLALVTGTVATGVMLLGGGEDELHEAVAYSLFAMIGLHVVAVIVMSVASRENLVRAMVTGRKPAAHHPGATDARPAPLFALPLAVIAVAVAAAGALRFDGMAFTPHTHDEAGQADGAGEHGDEAEGREGEDEAD